MWILFRDPRTVFNHLDKFVVEVVADGDIQAYQQQMMATLGGRAHEFHDDVYFLQPFFTSKDDVNYFARKYKTWQTTSS
jgi:hypothetical protein